MNNVINIVGRPPQPQRILRVPVGGAHRGAEMNLPAIRDYNSKSSTTIVPVYFDPMPGRALALQEAAARQGINADAVEGRIEDALASQEFEPSAPVILHLDRASAIASTLRDPNSHCHTVLAYIVVELPSKRMYGTASVIGPGELQARKDAIAFTQTLGEMTERGSSSAVFGESADPSHNLAEKPIRDRFAIHCSANLAKAIAGVEPMSSTFETFSTGGTSRPLFIVTRDAWSEPRALAKELIKTTASPIRRGIEFVLAQVVPGRDGGIRFHEIRRRKDNRISLQGSDTLDRATVEAEAQAREEAAALAAAAERARIEETSRPVPSDAPVVASIERPPAGSTALASLLDFTANALSRAERETVSRSNPVRTTD